jgi:CDP-diglyceride synthetase
MRDHAAHPSIRDQVLASTVIGAAAGATLLAGLLAVSAFLAVVLLVAYTDLRGLLGVRDERRHLATFTLGAGAVGAFLWCGYSGELERIPAFAAGLVIALLVTRVVLYETGVQMTGITADIASTTASAGVVGVLGAHFLLVRTTPRFGFRGLLAFALMVVAHDVFAFFVGRFRGRHVLNKLVAPNKTWEGALAGIAASTGVGAIVGFVLDPPFTVVSGAMFGAGVGMLATLGDLVFSAIKRSAGVRLSGAYLGGAGGALDIIDSALFSVPAFYWAFRTIAL